MLDFFVIFSKSGIVLFATVNQAFTQVVNKLIKHLILEERREEFTSESLALRYQLDNEFDLVFVVGYQKMLSLSYVDKFLDDVQLAFRDKFNDYDLRRLLQMQATTNSRTPETSDDGSLLNFNLVDFYKEYKSIYTKCYKMSQTVSQPEMRSFQQSAKSQKTIKSMIISSKNDPKPPAPVATVEPKTEPPVMKVLANKVPRGLKIEKPKKKEAKVRIFLFLSQTSH